MHHLGVFVVDGGIRWDSIVCLLHTMNVTVNWQMLELVGIFTMFMLVLNEYTAEGKERKPTHHMQARMLRKRWISKMSHGSIERGSGRILLHIKTFITSELIHQFDT